MHLFCRIKHRMQREASILFLKLNWKRSIPVQLHTPIYHRNLPRDLKPNPHPDTISVSNKQNKSMKIKPRIRVREYEKKKKLIFRCLA